MQFHTEHQNTVVDKAPVAIENGWKSFQNGTTKESILVRSILSLG